MTRVYRAFLLMSCVMVLAPILFAGSSSKSAETVDLTRQQWNGDAICYSGYRGAENPNKEIFPTGPEVLQDLTILSRHWHLIRLYGSDAHSEQVLKIVEEHHFPVKVLLGIWLSGGTGHKTDNEKQLMSGIALAQQYPDTVVAVSVANEALVSWSDHKMQEQEVIEAVERVRKAVRCPVTVADDYLYWVNPDAALAQHVDFITLHTYPVWGREDIDTGVASTVKNYEKVKTSHPGKTIVLGEIGWPSYTVGDKHVAGAGDERKQKQYFEQMNAWASSNSVTAFLFEAFDEPWKGAGTEGHWGLFFDERKAKLATQQLYPDLKPTTPSSPSSDAASAQVSK